MKYLDIDWNTVSYNTDDVCKQLKEHFNITFDSAHSFTTHEIYSVITSGMSKRSFGEYLAGVLRSSGRFTPHEQDKDNYDGYIKYCFDAFMESNIIKAQPIFDGLRPLTSTLLKKQLKNWFSGVSPSRENIFLLSLALKMSCGELNDMLTKGICDKGINYKDPVEVAVYSCLKNNKGYSDVLLLLSEAGAAAKRTDSEKTCVYTDHYRQIYEQIDTEPKLIQYLAKLTAERNDPQYSVCIKKCFDELMQHIFRYAINDKKTVISNEFGITISDPDKIKFGTVERYLYYYTPIKTENSRYSTQTYASYDNGNISGKQKNRMKDQKWFFSTLLRRSDLKKMYDGSKKISRDTIITLAFFVVCETNPEYGTYEYLCDINGYLSFCRFENINFDYPYDMFIFMCLQTDDPLTSFRKIWKTTWIK